MAHITKTDDGWTRVQMGGIQIASRPAGPGELMLYRFFQKDSDPRQYLTQQGGETTDAAQALAVSYGYLFCAIQHLGPTWVAEQFVSDGPRQEFDAAGPAITAHRAAPWLTLFYLDRTNYPNAAHRWVVAAAGAYPNDVVATPAMAQ